MGRKKKDEVIETKEGEIGEENTTIEPIAGQDFNPDEFKSEFKDGQWVITPISLVAIEGPNLTNISVTNEEVKPIVVTTNKFVQGDKVQLVNGVTNKVIAMAVDRKYAEKLVAKNPNLKIVK